MPSSNDPEPVETDARQQWIMAGAILAYSLAFFVVILRHHVAAVFSVCSSCSLLVQTAQYVRELRNPTTSHLVGGEDEASSGSSQSVTTSPRASHDATITATIAPPSTSIDLHCQSEIGHNEQNSRTVEVSLQPHVAVKPVNEIPATQ